MLDTKAMANALTAMGVPAANVLQNWPQIVAGLQWAGIDDRMTEIAAAATTVVETGIFLPIKEEGDQAYLENELGWQWPWCGRGDVQLTWRQGYVDAGTALGMDLVDNPDLALDPAVAGKVLAWYFKNNGIPALANAGNWYGVRRAVNGGYNGIAVFLQAVNILLGLPNVPSNPVTTVAVRGILRQTPQANGAHALDPHHQAVVLDPGRVIHFAPDPSPGPYHGRITTVHWAHLNVDKTPEHGWFPRNHLMTAFN